MIRFRRDIGNDRFPFLLFRKDEGEGGEGRLFHGTRESTHAPAHPAKSSARDSDPRQLVAVLPNVERKLAKSAAAAAATETASAIAGAATPSPRDGQLVSEPNTGAESRAGATAAAESGDPLAESAIGAAAAAESAGSDGQRAIPEREARGARGFQGKPSSVYHISEYHSSSITSRTEFITL